MEDVETLELALEFQMLPRPLQDSSYNPPNAIQRRGLNTISVKKHSSGYFQYSRED